MKTTVLLSGGLDSTVLCSHLTRAGHEVRALSINYGQRHRCELGASRLVAHSLDIGRDEVDISGALMCFARSALTTDAPMPHGHYEDESMKQTVVPNRNMVLLSLAIAHAISNDCEAVCYAAHAGDHAIYPDCRPEFIAIMEQAAMLCDYRPIAIRAPLAGMTKAEVVALGSRCGAPLGLTWSCYEGGKIHCGKCGTCVERREAFQVAGVEDPTEYQP